MEEIVRVATTLIAERGYYGISLQEVADGCNLTVAGLLHHVKSKDGLLIAVLAHRDALDLEEAGIQPRDPGRRDPRAYLDQLVRRNQQQPEIVRLYTILDSEALDPSHPAHEYFNARYQDSIAVIADLLVGHVDDPRASAAHVLAVMDGVQLQWLRFPDEVDLFARWTAIADRLFGSP